ncbi:MAG TPA: DUF302 domain-containing protein [Candidatus Nitrosotalea sp.]|nr:DUF302 domain-containing protein [Candidatus Nitrosotalea sp.]
MTASYFFELRLDRSLAQAEVEVRSALSAEGFGVLTEIDVEATMRDKLGLNVPAEKILGACNPRLAHAALQVEPGAAVLLPCNVVLRDVGEGVTEIRFMDAEAALGVIGNPELGPIAKEAGDRLRRVAQSLQAGS